FSSRRRHTRWPRDWSSDVCSSDLQVDLVDITLPNSLHADVAVRALESGKHVLCEKPMALTLADCERMVAAAKKANRLLMIGHVRSEERRVGKEGRLLRWAEYS